MATPGFLPTHVVPGHGMPAWEEPDPARPTVPLDPLLPVQLLERRGDRGHTPGVKTDGSCGSVIYDDMVVRTDSGWRVSHQRISARRVPLSGATRP